MVDKLDTMLTIKPPVLQVALDFTRIEDALKVSEAVISGGADWLECGTPLIKSEGVKAIKTLKTTFPDIPLVADLKTMDTGALEAELAFSSGADVITVLAAADNKTILDALEVAKNYGGLVMADLINYPTPLNRAKELEILGVHIILMHLGIDQQRFRAFPIDDIPLVKKEIKSFLAVAGGLNDLTARQAFLNGADILVVGGFITRSANPREATRKIKEALRSGA